VRTKVSSDLPNAEYIREEILGQFSELFAGDGAAHNNNIGTVIYSLSHPRIISNECSESLRLVRFCSEEWRNYGGGFYER
jgi:hypothetical protein